MSEPPGLPSPLSPPPAPAAASAAAVEPAFDGDDEPPTRPGDLPCVPSAPSEPADLHAIVTVLGGVNAGQVFTLDRPENDLGRGRDAHVHVDGAGVSRKHARIFREGDRYVLEDLGASYGVFVNGDRVRRVELRSGDRVQLGPTVAVRFALVAADEKALATQLYEGSMRDALTGAMNRKYFDQRFVEEMAYAKRHGTRLGLVILDLDHFKRANDDHGHLAGDMVLRVVTAQLQRVIRKEDVLARYGGEEFVVLVRGIEPRNVCILAERLRRAVETLEIPWETTWLRITASLGVASLEECAAGATPDAILKLADGRLYEAKRLGRNRVCS